MNQLTIIILSIVLIGMVCFPLIIYHFRQKGKGNLLMERLKKEGNLSHLRPSDFVTWRQAYCIGLDQQNKQLLFLNTLETGDQVQKIDLNQVQICKPIRHFREINEGKDRRQIIKKVSLVMDQLDERMKPLEIEFYDEDKNDYMVNEWELAQTWSKKMNDLIN